jgi:arylsulfatase A-like enzyme
MLPVRMVRQRLLTLLLMFGAVLPVLAEDAKRRMVSAAGRPNFLFIIVDDLNDWVGWMGGHPQAKTPHMDRLAKRGMRFTNAHTTYALCNPSRTALLTGAAPWKSGVHGNEQDWRRSVRLSGKPTLPQFFQSKGWLTAAGGKVWHANHGGPESRLTGWHGGRRGFEQDGVWDARFPAPGVQIPPLPVPTGQNFNGLDIWHWDWGKIDVPEQQMDDAQVVSWASEYLAQKHRHPFFLAVGLYRPHSPWYVPKRFFDLFPLNDIRLPEVKEDDLADLPETAKAHVKREGLHQKLVEKDLWKPAVQAYLANIAYADEQVGRLLDALESSTHAANTVICLTSDHGWYLGEKQMWHKGRLWERATRVPLTCYVPKLTKPDSLSAQPVSLLDLYPTFTELAKLKAPEHLDGKSLLPLLRDPESLRMEPAITIMGGGEKFGASARDAQWRYIRYADGSEELYDHQSDPHEWTNLAGQAIHSATQERLAKTLPQQWLAAQRPADEVIPPLAADGSLTMSLIVGDQLASNLLPNLAGRGFDVEADFTYDPAVDSDSTLITQGDGTNGWAVHFVARAPTLSLFHDGVRSSYALAPLSSGACKLRVVLSGNGTVSMHANGGGELNDRTRFLGGIPFSVSGPLTAGQSFGPLNAKDFPNSTPFDGAVRRLWLTILPEVK